MNRHGRELLATCEGDRFGVGRHALVLGLHGCLRRPRRGRPGYGPRPGHQHRQPVDDYDLLSMVRGRRMGTSAARIVRRWT